MKYLNEVQTCRIHCSLRDQSGVSSHLSHLRVLAVWVGVTMLLQIAVARFHTGENRLRGENSGRV